MTPPYETQLKNNIANLQYQKTIPSTPNGVTNTHSRARIVRGDSPLKAKQRPQGGQQV